ncbi:MAG: glycosyltransferase family 2 protein [Patescibacteria group bacterium]
MQLPAYQRLARASDLADPKERRIYRALEIMPGALSWGTLAAGVLCSWLFPVWTAFIITVFVVFWLFRLLYLGFHLAASYRQMRRNEKTDWAEELRTLPPDTYSLPISSWRDLYHLVVLPSYNESLDILRQSLLSIRQNMYPAERILVVLGMEEREGREAEEKASILEREFGEAFFSFLITKHPAELPDEIPGKASNETWALRKAKEEVLDKKGILPERVIVTSLDADTVLSPQYLGCLTYHFLVAEDPLHVSFQPIPLFLNNVEEAPALSRVFAFNSTFWHTMNQQRPEKLISFSSHSMGLKALLDVGFKQPNVVSDDSRIFWQCFLYYDGNWRTQPLHCPVSMDANAAPTLWRTIQHIYLQQRRWAYGVADVPYAFFGFFKNKKIPRRRAFALGGEILFGFWSWATASMLIFLLGWLPLLLGGGAFSQTLVSYNLPRFVSIMLRLAMLGVVGSMYLSILLLPVDTSYGKKKKLFLVLQWFLLPLTMVAASLPALEAQTRLMLGRYMGFWPTPKWRRPEAHRRTG